MVTGQVTPISLRRVIIFRSYEFQRYYERNFRKLTKEGSPVPARAYKEKAVKGMLPTKAHQDCTLNDKKLKSLWMEKRRTLMLLSGNLKLISEEQKYMQAWIEGDYMALRAGRRKKSTTWPMNVIVRAEKDCQERRNDTVILMHEDGEKPQHR